MSCVKARIVPCKKAVSVIALLVVPAWKRKAKGLPAPLGGLTLRLTTGSPGSQVTRTPPRRPLATCGKAACPPFAFGADLHL